MINKYISYFITFSARFFFRILFLRAFKIKEMEVRLVTICQTLASRALSMVRLSHDKIRLTLVINERIFNIVLRRDTSDLLAVNQILLQREYSPLHDLILEHGCGEPIEVIVDVGANIGMTCLFFSSVFPKATIYAIEPSERNFEILRVNMEGNGLRVLALNKALLACRAKVKLVNTFRDKRDWSTQVARSTSEMGIEAISLTDVRLECKLDRIDVLKIDIEGHEAELFQSEQFLSELERVKFLAIEVHEEYADRIAIINLLQDRGYRLISKGETLFGYNERSTAW